MIINFIKYLKYYIDYFQYNIKFIESDNSNKRHLKYLAVFSILIYSQPIFSQSICDKYSPQLIIDGTNLLEPSIKYVSPQEVARIKNNSDLYSDHIYNDKFQKDDRIGKAIGLYSPPYYQIQIQSTFQKFEQTNKTFCYVPMMKLTFMLKSPTIHISNELNSCLLNVVINHERKHHQDTLKSYNLAAQSILDIYQKEKSTLHFLNLNLPMFLNPNDPNSQKKINILYEEQNKQISTYLTAYSNIFSKTFRLYQNYYASLIDNLEYNKNEMAICAPKQPR